MNTEQMLKLTCTMGVQLCLALSTYRTDILKFFDNFVYFNNLEGNAILLTAGNNGFVAGNNGFVYKLTYKKGNITTYAILKSSMTAESDNLAYEFIVGLFINKFCSIFPCFVQTYGLYYYKDESSWNRMLGQGIESVSADNLQQYLELQHSYNFADICEKSKIASILVESIENSRSLQWHMSNDNRFRYGFVHYELIYILYQIYMPLFVMRDSFTHYDLHLGNVMLYMPSRDKYIQYHYHIHTDTVVKFKSVYLAKIIDYGRCFVKNETVNGSRSSHVIYHMHLDRKECQPNRGENNGFFSMTEEAKTDYHNCSYKNNQSHDLRLLHSIDYIITKKSISLDLALTDFKNVLKNTTYGVDILQKPGHAQKGTKENKVSGILDTFQQQFSGSKINNVRDAEYTLREIIVNNDFLRQANDINYKDTGKLGDLHVYSNGRPMEFIPEPLKSNK